MISEICVLGRGKEGEESPRGGKKGKGATVQQD